MVVERFRLRILKDEGIERGGSVFVGAEGATGLCCEEKMVTTNMEDMVWVVRVKGEEEGRRRRTAEGGFSVVDLRCIIVREKNIVV